MKHLQSLLNMLRLSLPGLVLLLAGCSAKSGDTTAPPPPLRNAIVGLASPFRLEPGENVLYIADYFHHPEKLDSFTAQKGLSAWRAGDSLMISAVDAEGFPIQKLTFFSEGLGYDIPVFVSSKKPVEVTLADPDKKYGQVQLKGEMNAWNPNAGPLTYSDGYWKCSLWLEPGNYQYKLVADGTEIDHPENEETLSNGMGGFNNVLHLEAQGTKPHLTTLSHSDKTVVVKTEPGAGVFALWNNMVIEAESDKAGIYSLTIPAGADNELRSYVRVFCANENGLGNDLLIPLHNGQVLSSVDELNRRDYHNLVLYNVFIDRFFDGDSSNNKPTPNDSILPRANFHGGDLLGIIAKVHEGYFQNLGVNGLWLSPIVKNVKGAYGYWPKPESKFSAYHGYWPVSFTQIDKRLGSATNFEELVDKVHHDDMNLFLDFVANHVHKKHPVYKAHKDWATKLYLKDGSLNTQRWDDHRLSTWFDVFLPSLKLYEPEVYNMLSDSAVWWVKKYHVDGFRHDATKHVPHHFWRALTQKLKTQVEEPTGVPLYQIGETYGSRPLVGSYVNTGELNAQFDFNMYDDAVAVFAANEGIERLAESLEKSMQAFGAHHLMGNISGNQDRARFVSYADGSIRFNEDPKAAGWTRDIEIQDSVAYQKMALLMAYNFFIPGVPVVYYGDEIGMPGGNDPDNRRMMRFNNLNAQEQHLKKTVAELAALRHRTLALQFGDTRIVKAENGLLVVERRYFDQIVFLVINNNGTQQAITFSNEQAADQAQFGAVAATQNGETQVLLPAFSFEILTN